VVAAGMRRIDMLMLGAGVVRRSTFMILQPFCSFQVFDMIEIPTNHVQTSLQRTRLGVVAGGPRN
jgi:hypothetical protein